MAAADWLPFVRTPIRKMTDEWLEWTDGVPLEEDRWGWVQARLQNQNCACCVRVGDLVALHNIRIEGLRHDRN